MCFEKLIPWARRARASGQTPSETWIKQAPSDKVSSLPTHQRTSYLSCCREAVLVNLLYVPHTETVLLAPNTSTCTTLIFIFVWFSQTRQTSLVLTSWESFRRASQSGLDLQNLSADLSLGQSQRLFPPSLGGRCRSRCRSDLHFLRLEHTRPKGRWPSATDECWQPEALRIRAGRSGMQLRPSASRRILSACVWPSS